MDALSNRASVLIVDDDAFNREGMRLYLTRHSFAVAEAGDEATALALAQQQRFDIAVLDIAIPPLPNQRAHSTHSTGIRLAHHLKQHDPRIGIVLFSAYEDRGRDVLGASGGRRARAGLPAQGLSPRRAAARDAPRPAGRVLP
jgi:CheY-like chemotaxis protein